MDVTLVPYLLVDNDKVRRFPRSEAAKLIESKVAANGVHPLMWVFITNTALFSSVAKPIVNPEDFKGLRVRSLQGLNQDMFRLLGAEPTPMPPRDVTQWIRDGKGDGATTDVVAQADFDLAAKASADAVETLRASGMTIHVQTASERAAWEKALVGPLTAQFAKQSADAAKVLELVKGL